MADLFPGIRALPLVALTLASCPTGSPPTGGLDPGFVDPRAHQDVELSDVGLMVDANCIGFAAGPAGDLDGDGFDSFWLAGDTCWDSEPPWGAIYLFDGPVSEDLDASHAVASYEGTVGFEYLGAAAVVGPDLTGDGISDLAIGVTPDWVSDEDAGAVLVFAGPLEGAHSPAEAHAVIPSSRETRQVGQALAAGDFDGDGQQDLAVGAPGSWSAEASYVGAVLVFHGPLEGQLLPEEAEAVITPTEPTPYLSLGSRLAAVDDVDADGADELAVAAWGGALAPGGGVFVFDGPLQGALDFDDPRLMIRSKVSGHALGRGLATGDVDADGVPDLVLGAPGAGEPSRYYLGDGEGVSWIVSADRDGTVDVSNLPVALVGESEWDRAGDSVAVIGDIDGDGFADVAIGGPRARSSDDSGAFDEGAVWIVRGPIDDRLDLAWADLRLNGDYQDGRIVAPAGDVDGDGRDDLLVTDGGGSAWLVLGAALEFP